MRARYRERVRQSLPPRGSDTWPDAEWDRSRRSASRAQFGHAPDRGFRRTSAGRLPGFPRRPIEASDRFRSVTGRIRAAGSRPNRPIPLRPVRERPRPIPSPSPVAPAIGRLTDTEPMNKSTDPDDFPAELQSIRKWMRRFEAEAEVAPASAECVIYARFSGRAQKEASIERQAEVCTGYAAQMDFELRSEHLFADRGKTGDSLDDRTALEEIRRLARSKAFGRLLLYGWDRLSRRSADGMMLFDEFTALGIEIHVATGSATGRVDLVKATFLSLCAMEERERFLRTTNYAQWVAAGKGTNIGAVPYGFRKGRGRGEIVVEEEEMKVVIRIFTLFVVHRISPRKIAYILNKEGIQAPRGGLWSQEAIAGSRIRSGGILRNPKYIGWLIYGRMMRVRTPGRAKTVTRVRSSTHWKKVYKPELARVDPELWRKANALLDETACDDRDEPRERRSRSVLVFHGSYRCVCGQKMLLGGQGVSGVRRLVCAAALKHGTCDRRGSTSSLFVEAEILREIRDNILSDRAVELFEAEFVVAMQRARDEALRTRAVLTERIGQIDRWFDASIDRAVLAGLTSDQEIGQRKRLNDERERLAKELANVHVPDGTVDLAQIAIPKMRDEMNRLIMRMPLKDPTEADLKLVSALRRLIDRVAIDRMPGQEGYTLTIDASLVGLSACQTIASRGLATQRFVRACAALCSGRVRTPELMEHLAGKAKTNDWSTSEEDWSVVAPAWSGWEHPKKRLYLDATLFYLRSEILSLSTLPPPYDDESIEYGVKVMIAKGHWASALAALEQVCSPAVANLDTSRLAAKTRRLATAR